MEDILKQELDLSWIHFTGETGSGEICTGKAYNTNKGKIFVKHYERSTAMAMFEGECAGLQTIGDTKIIKVPKYKKIVQLDDGSALLALEFLNMKPLEKHAKLMGQKLAELHLLNAKKIAKMEKNESYVRKMDNTVVVQNFGFDTVTYNGHLRQTNTWCSDWLSFFVQQRLKPHIDELEIKYGHCEALSLWPIVERNIPKLFPKGLKITPSLLHGDLWYGNAGELENEPCVFDPIAFYGHSEYDLSMPHVFGGFSELFFDEYHRFLPKAQDFDKREKLYLLLLYLNHWNQLGPVHDGRQYRENALKYMRYLANL
uniref:ketosamine-3-kinase-like n=1 Tax=Styela clava TaxID=7725 RepID=UPI0019398466|nr:ketosamine-3-kinase-like [Styela clava]